MFDLTLPIDEGMPAWPGTPSPQQTWLERLTDGDQADVSAWTLGSHAGTHIDAPSHFLPGASDLESTPLSTLIGRCVVLDLTMLPGHVTSVSLVSCADAWTGHARVLLKTRNSLAPPLSTFDPSFAALDLDAAHLLIQSGITLVGADALSIESVQSIDAGAPVHRALLEAGVVIVEGLVLRDVPPGEYTLVALPPRLQHSEAAPVRAVLFEPRDVL